MSAVDGTPATAGGASRPATAASRPATAGEPEDGTPQPSRAVSRAQSRGGRDGRSRPSSSAGRAQVAFDLPPSDEEDGGGAGGGSGPASGASSRAPSRPGSGRPGSGGILRKPGSSKEASAPSSAAVTPASSRPASRQARPPSAGDADSVVPSARLGSSQSTRPASSASKARRAASPAASAKRPATAGTGWSGRPVTASEAFSASGRRRRRHGACMLYFLHYCVECWSWDCAFGGGPFDERRLWSAAFRCFREEAPRRSSLLLLGYRALAFLLALALEVWSWVAIILEYSSDPATGVTASGQPTSAGSAPSGLGVSDLAAAVAVKAASLSTFATWLTIFYFGSLTALGLHVARCEGTLARLGFPPPMSPDEAKAAAAKSEADAKWATALYGPQPWWKRACLKRAATKRLSARRGRARGPVCFCVAWGRALRACLTRRPPSSHNDEPFVEPPKPRLYQKPIGMPRPPAAFALATGPNAAYRWYRCCRWSARGLIGITWAFLALECIVYWALVYQTPPVTPMVVSAPVTDLAEPGSDGVGGASYMYTYLYNASDPGASVAVGDLEYRKDDANATLYLGGAAGTSGAGGVPYSDTAIALFGGGGAVIGAMGWLRELLIHLGLLLSVTTDILLGRVRVGDRCVWVALALGWAFVGVNAAVVLGVNAAGVAGDVVNPDLVPGTSSPYGIGRLAPIRAWSWSDPQASLAIAAAGLGLLTATYFAGSALASLRDRCCCCDIRKREAVLHDRAIRERIAAVVAVAMGDLGYNYSTGNGWRTERAALKLDSAAGGSSGGAGVTTLAVAGGAQPRLPALEAEALPAAPSGSEGALVPVTASSASPRPTAITIAGSSVSVASPSRSTRGESGDASSASPTRAGSPSKQLTLASPSASPTKGLMTDPGADPLAPASAAPPLLPVYIGRMPHPDTGLEEDGPLTHAFDPLYVVKALSPQSAAARHGRSVREKVMAEKHRKVIETIAAAKEEGIYIDEDQVREEAGLGPAQPFAAGAASFGPGVEEQDPFKAALDGDAAFSAAHGVADELGAYDDSGWYPCTFIDDTHAYPMSSCEPFCVWAAGGNAPRAAAKRRRGWRRFTCCCCWQCCKYGAPVVPLADLSSSSSETSESSDDELAAVELPGSESAYESEGGGATSGASVSGVDETGVPGAPGAAAASLAGPRLALPGAAPGDADGASSRPGTAGTGARPATRDSSATRGSGARKVSGLSTDGEKVLVGKDSKSFHRKRKKEGKSVADKNLAAGGFMGANVLDDAQEMALPRVVIRAIKRQIQAPGRPSPWTAEDERNIQLTLALSPRGPRFGPISVTAGLDYQGGASGGGAGGGNGGEGGGGGGGAGGEGGPASPGFMGVD